MEEIAIAVPNRIAPSNCFNCKNQRDCEDFRQNRTAFKFCTKWEHETNKMPNKRNR